MSWKAAQVVATVLTKLGNGDARGERREGYVDLQEEVHRITESVNGLPQQVATNRADIEKHDERTRAIERTMATRDDLKGLATKEDVGLLRTAVDGLSRRLDRHFEGGRR